MTTRWLSPTVCFKCVLWYPKITNDFPLSLFFFEIISLVNLRNSPVRLFVGFNVGNKCRIIDCPK